MISRKRFSQSDTSLLNDCSEILNEYHDTGDTSVMNRNDFCYKLTEVAIRRLNKDFCDLSHNEIDDIAQTAVSSLVCGIIKNKPLISDLNPYFRRVLKCRVSDYKRSQYLGSSRVYSLDEILDNVSGEVSEDYTIGTDDYQGYSDFRRDVHVQIDVNNLIKRLRSVLNDHYRIKNPDIYLPLVVRSALNDDFKLLDMIDSFQVKTYLKIISIEFRALLLKCYKNLI